MPKNITRQNIAVGHIKKGAQNKSSRSVKLALQGKAFVGRVDKNLGQYFQVSYYDKENKKLHSDILASPCGSFCAKGKVRVRICVGDIVVLDGLQELESMKQKGKQFIVEITGKVDDRRDVDALVESGEIPSSLSNQAAVEEGDDCGVSFDRTPDEEEEEIDVNTI